MRKKELSILRKFNWRKIMRENEILCKRIADINLEFYNKDLITPTGGNISARSPETPEEIWLTPGGIYKNTLTYESMLCVDLEANLLKETKYKPTSETPMHLAIYKNRPDVNAVIHTHAVYTTIYGLTSLDFLPISAEAVMVGELPVIPWTKTGSRESGSVVVEALGSRGFCVVIDDHGLVVAAPTLDLAAGITDMVEATCKKLVMCKLLGVEPHLLSSDNINDILELMRSHGAVG